MSLSITSIIVKKIYEMLTILSSEEVSSIFLVPIESGDGGGIVECSLLDL